MTIPENIKRIDVIMVLYSFNIQLNNKVTLTKHIFGSDLFYFDAYTPLDY